MVAIKQLGEYTITAKLGAGGFGTVYKAEAADKTVVALKLLNADMLENDRVLQKFLDEAMILASMEHKNITKFIRLVKEKDSFAIAMEYVDGVALKDLMEKQKLSFEESFNMIKQILEAFDFAHAKRIIHRDIKPANIMLTKEGEIKVMDFGIAKISTTQSQGTSKWGTYHYSAPERFKGGGEVDARTDIYSLGVMFYEMFTGHRPFESDDTARLIYCHVNEMPPPMDGTNGIPSEVNKAIMTSLAKEPDDRFGTCAEFIKAMDAGYEYSDESTSYAPPPPEAIAAAMRGDRKKIPLPMILGGVALLLLIAGGVYYKMNVAGSGGKAGVTTARVETRAPAQTVAPGKVGIAQMEQAKLFGEQALESYEDEDYDKAFKFARNAIETYDSEFNALSVIAYIYYDRDELTKSLEFLNRALVVKPGDADTLTMLGVVHMDRREFDRSLEFLNKAKAINPDDEDIQDWIDTALKAKQSAG